MTKSKLAYFLALLLTGCVSDPLPTPQASGTGGPMTLAPTTITIPSPSAPQAPVASVNDIVGASACTSHKWPNGRGVMPRSTVLGFGMTFQRALCAKRSVYTQPANRTTIEVLDKKTGKTHLEAKTDVLAVYPKVDPTLPNVYALMLASASMESSGNVCTGRDKSAGAETSLEAEAGLMQQSANVLELDPEMRKIYDEYRAHPDHCLFSSFSKQACSTAGVVVGSGAEFQKFMLTCPAAAVEQAALGSRVNVRHWGPARRAELEFVPACVTMFQDIAKATVCE